MEDRTKTTLDLLSRVDYFNAVGTLKSNGVLILASWRQAARICKAIKWENVRLLARTPLLNLLVNHYPERSEQWNNLINEINAILEPILSERIYPIIIQHQLPDTVSHNIHWDLIHIALESEYADVMQPNFYANMANWYIRGHLPCGWQGEYPEGRLIIY